jgi:hypothetical protein
VSGDGRSLTLIPRAVHSPAQRNCVFAVWSRHTLQDGAQRWSLTWPIGRSVWIGVGDVRTRRPKPPKPGTDTGTGARSRSPEEHTPDTVNAGSWCGPIVVGYPSIAGAWGSVSRAQRPPSHTATDTASASAAIEVLAAVMPEWPPSAALTRTTNAFLNQSTVVQCTFDDTAHTTSLRPVRWSLPGCRRPPSSVPSF